MKVESSKDKIIVYLFDDKYYDLNIKDTLINVFDKLNKYYNIEFKSSYILDLYVNKYYGMILEIDKKSFSLYDNVVNLKLNIKKDSLFLYEIEDVLNYLDYEIYHYNDRFFVNIKDININIFEDANIIYGTDVYKIIGKGIKI